MVFAFWLLIFTCLSVLVSGHLIVSGLNLLSSSLSLLVFHLHLLDAGPFSSPVCAIWKSGEPKVFGVGFTWIELSFHWVLV